jgi:hypothetical protein
MLEAKVGPCHGLHCAARARALCAGAADHPLAGRFLAATRPWAHLLHSGTTGRTAFADTYGTRIFAYLGRRGPAAPRIKGGDGFPNSALPVGEDDYWHGAAQYEVATISTGERGFIERVTATAASYDRAQAAGPRRTRAARPSLTPRRDTHVVPPNLFRAAPLGPLPRRDPALARELVSGCGAVWLWLLGEVQDLRASVLPVAWRMRQLVGAGQRSDRGRPVGRSQVAQPDFRPNVAAARPLGSGVLDASRAPL